MTLPQSMRTNSLGSAIANPPGKRRAEMAVVGFWILGTNAASAIPELARLANDRPHSQTSMNAKIAHMLISGRVPPHVLVPKDPVSIPAHP
jgi:hypothetical protein